MNRFIAGVGKLAVPFIGVLAWTSAWAGVQLNPTELFVKPPNKSAAVVVRNPSTSDIEVWVTFEYSYPVAFDTSGVTFSTAKPEDPDEQSATGWLRSIPQRFTLKGQESQVVRVYCTPPAGLRSGEYWARVVISSKEVKKVTQQKKDQLTQFKMNLITQSTLPFHFRSGPTTTGVTVREVRAEPAGGKLQLSLLLDRTGNAAFWGRMNTRLLGPKGRVVRTDEFRLVVYKSFQYRTLIDVSGDPPGDYTLEIAIDNKHPGVNSQFRIPCPSVVQRVPFVLP